MSAIKKVYLIDDDEINNFICTNILKKINFSDDVVAFESGTEALEVLKKAIAMGDAEQIPDVIFLDINMPIMNGWDFLEEYKQLKSDIDKTVSLFMLSSSIYQADVEKSKQYGEVVDFVTKPLNAEILNEIKDKYFE
ncbi:response regulator [bacterium]|nr:response regulator [bacterium]